MINEKDIKAELTTEFKQKQTTKKSHKNLIIGLVVLLLAAGLVIGIIYGVSLAKEKF